MAANVDKYGFPIATPAEAGGAVVDIAAPAAKQSSLAERFDARCLSSARRLAELAEELDRIDSENAQPALLLEAQQLAHIMAGTAGMFGQPRLGHLASTVETEMKEFGLSPAPLDQAMLGTPLKKLAWALAQAPLIGEPRAGL